MRSAVRPSGLVGAAILLFAVGAHASEPRTSFAFREGPSAEPERAAEAPMSLTASDGTGLRLVRLSARAVVQDPLAFTELHLAFENPQDRVIEGHFRITLPQGAAISRFAMKIGDSWQEGEVVEKQAARRAYEDFLHRRQDPALLEQAAGNEFGARVFPIPARGLKELVVSYSQELGSGGAPYQLPLRGLPELGELSVSVSAPGAAPQTLERKKYVPNADFVFAPPRAAARGGLRHEDLALVRVQPLSADTAPDAVSSLLVLVDTSASRGLGFAQQVKLVEGLAEGLAAGAGASTPLAVACFDQEVELIFDGKAGDFGQKELKALRARRALGASDLEGALGWARELVAKKGLKRLLLVTDGVATAGATEGDALSAALLRLKRDGLERADAVAVGGIRDDALLRRLVTAGLPRDGVVVDSAEGLSQIGSRLTRATRSGLKVELPGATWYWPKKLDGVQTGDEVLVYAELPRGKPVALTVGGQAMKVGELITVERPLLERAWVQAKIASLLHRRDVEADGAAQKAELQKQIVELSVSRRVLSPFTALLVLETEQDYARFGIDRRALADILTVDPQGRLALQKRAGEALAVKTDPPRPQKPAKGGEAKKDKAKAEEAGDETLSARPMDLLGAAAPAPQAPPAPSAAAPATVPMAEPSDQPMEAKALAADEDSAPRGAAAPEEAREMEAPRMAQRAAAAPSAPAPTSRSAESERRLRREVAEDRVGPQEGAAPQGEAPYVGRFKTVMDAVVRGELKKAEAEAFGWHEEDPGDVMALVAMGEAWEAAGELKKASRAYGSIIDLFSARADLRRFAGTRLERIKNGAGLALAADSFAKAAEQRPDHPASHRLLAFALIRKGEPQKAFEAIARGLTQSYPSGRFAGVDQILREDLGLAAAAWIRKEPGRRAEIVQKLQAAGGTLEEGPSLRFVLNWETDANDVDFHIYDAKGGHAYYGSRNLPSGGSLYADVTTGYGPECFTIRLPKGRRAGPYKLQAHYYSRGPMGYGMGKLQIVEHDGKGGLAFEERPFVVMVDGAYVDLGTVRQ